MSLDKKITLISILTYCGFDMSAWEKKDSIELSEEHITKLDTMKTEHEQLTTDNAQLKTDKQTAEADLVTAESEKNTAEKALRNAMATANAATGALSMDVKVGATLSDVIGEIATLAGAKPGAKEHSESVSDNDSIEEGAEANYAHNRSADEQLGTK